MKNFLIPFFFLLLNITCSNLCFALQTTIFPIQDIFNNPMITLRAGTVVSLTTNEEIDAEAIAVGHAIDFFVRSNVTVNGNVVIAAGAIGEGWIKKITTSCNGDCLKITITAENVQTVDGQRVFIRSIPHTVVLKFDRKKRNDLTIPIGTNLSARILNDIEISF